MSSYILVVVWIAFMAIIYNTVQTQRTEIVLGKAKVRCTPAFAFIVMLPLVYWAGTRYRWFGDTNMYWRTFEGITRSWSGAVEFAKNASKDKAYYFLAGLIKLAVGDHPVAYLTVIALIQSVLLIIAYRKYSCNYILSIFLFVMTTDYYSWMYNGIRQFTAASIMFAGAGFLFRKKYVPMILLILFASLFHASALIMLPAVFIVQGKALNKRTIAMFVISLLVLRYVGPFTRWMERALTETQYSNVVSDWQSWQDNGTNPLRVLVYSVPTIIAAFGLRNIRQYDDPIVNVSVNMSVISTGLYLVSMVTSGVFIGRLPIYFSMYAFGILLPWEINYLFTENSRRFVWLIMVMGFLGFYYYQMHLSWHLI